VTKESCQFGIELRVENNTNMKNLFFLFATFLVSNCLATSKLSSLRQFVFQGYDKLIKPDEGTSVRFGLSLINLDLKTESQVF